MLQGYPDVLNIKQVCEILKISTKTGCRLLKDGKIQNLKVWRSYWISKAHLVAYFMQYEPAVIQSWHPCHLFSYQLYSCCQQQILYRNRSGKNWKADKHMAAELLEKIQHLLYHFKLQGQQRNTKNQIKETSGSPSARTAFNLYPACRRIRCPIGQSNYVCRLYAQMVGDCKKLHLDYHLRKLSEHNPICNRPIFLPERNTTDWP